MRPKAPTRHLADGSSSRKTRLGIRPGPKAQATLNIRGPLTTQPRGDSLQYKFKVNLTGKYQLQLRALKRLEGNPGDQNNDAFIKMEGLFESRNSAVPKSALTDHTKIFGSFEFTNPPVKRRCFGVYITTQSVDYARGIEKWNSKAKVDFPFSQTNTRWNVTLVPKTRNNQPMLEQIPKAIISHDYYLSNPVDSSVQLSIKEAFQCQQQ